MLGINRDNGFWRRQALRLLFLGMKLTNRRECGNGIPPMLDAAAALSVKGVLVGKGTGGDVQGNGASVLFAGTEGDSVEGKASAADALALWKFNMASAYRTWAVRVWRWSLPLPRAVSREMPPLGLPPEWP
jgi:hypothetical protein